MNKKNSENLTNIVDSGTELEILKSLRHKLADAIENSNSGRDVAALSRQLREVVAKISEIESAEHKEKDISMLDLILLKSKLSDNIYEGEIEEDEKSEALEEINDALNLMEKSNVANIKLRSAFYE